MPTSSEWSLPSTFSNQNFVCFSHFFHACYMTLLNLINEKYKLWSSSLCSLLQPPATSPLLSTPFELHHNLNEIGRYTKPGIKHFEILMKILVIVFGSIISTTTIKWRVLNDMSCSGITMVSPASSSAGTDRQTDRIGHVFPPFLYLFSHTIWFIFPLNSLYDLVPYLKRISIQLLCYWHFFKNSSFASFSWWWFISRK
jgi:hypothetical protein